jgi:hypothetical protein
VNEGFLNRSGMQSRLYAILLMALVLSLPACAQSQSDQVSKHAPQIKFDQEEFNFGELAEGTLAGHVFKFKNTGNDTLHITRLEPG